MKRTKEFKINIPLDALPDVAERLVKLRKLIGPVQYTLSGDGRSVEAIVVGEDVHDFMALCFHMKTRFDSPRKIEEIVVHDTAKPIQFDDEMKCEAVDTPVGGRVWSGLREQPKASTSTSTSNYKLIPAQAIASPQDPKLFIADFKEEEPDYKNPKLEFYTQNFCNVIYQLDGGPGDPWELMRIMCPGVSFAENVGLAHIFFDDYCNFMPRSRASATNPILLLNESLWDDSYFLSAHTTRNDTARIGLYKASLADSRPECPLPVVRASRAYYRSINRTVTAALIEALQYVKPRPKIEVVTKGTCMEALIAANDFRHRRVLQDVISDFNEISANTAAEVFKNICDDLTLIKSTLKTKSSGISFESGIINHFQQYPRLLIKKSEGGYRDRLLSSYCFMFSDSMEYLYMMRREGSSQNFELLRIGHEAADLLYAMLTRERSERSVD